MKQFIIIILIFLLACEKEVELDIPQSPPQLLVNAILMPTQNVEVYVSLSQYVMDTFVTTISDAIVELYCDNDLVAQLTHSEDGKYSQQGILPQVGKTYSLTVDVDGFETATAQTTVPNSIALDSLVITQNIGVNNNGDKTSAFDLYFNKNDKVENYYSYACIGGTDPIDSTFYDTGDTIITYYETGGISTLSCYHPAILKDGDEQSRIFSDKEIESDLINLKLFTSFLVWNLPTATYTFEINAQINALSKEQYLFHKSLENYYTQQGQILGGNTLPHIYSNVNNALGCFSAITPGNIVIKYEEVECEGWR